MQSKVEQLPTHAPDFTTWQSLRMICTLLYPNPAYIYSFKERLAGPLHQTLYSIGIAMIQHHDYIKVFALCSSINQILQETKLTVGTEDVTQLFFELVDFFKRWQTHLQITLIQKAYTSIPLEKAVLLSGSDQKTFLDVAQGRLDPSTGLFHPISVSHNNAEATQREWQKRDPFAHLSVTSEQVCDLIGINASAKAQQAYYLGQ